MADISKVKTINGTTYDLKDSTGRKEAYLEWGGKNFSASYGCIDAAMVSSLGANRFALLNAAGITVEYTRDGGTTWTDYGLTDVQKTQLFTDTGYTCRVGKSTNVAGNRADPNCLLRVTIDTLLARCYSVLNKFVLYITTGGSSGCYVTIDRATHAAPTTWMNVVDKIGIAGYSGYNVINTPGITTYGNSDSQNQFLRFTFGVGNSATNVGLGITQIMAFGGVGWTTASTMAKNGHLYTYDASQNVTFPNGVKAGGEFGAVANKYYESTSSSSGLNMNNSDIIRVNSIYTADASNNASEGINFYRDATHWDTLWIADGNIYFVPNRVTGTNTTAANSEKVGRFTATPTTGQVVVTNGTTGGMTSSGYTIAKSVPSNAKFTDTNTWTAFKGATASAAGTAGYVPAPAKGDQAKFFRADGTWVVPTNTNTTYTISRSSGNSIKLTPSSGTAQTVAINTYVVGATE